MNAPKKTRDTAKNSEIKPGSVMKEVVKALKAEKFTRKANRSADKKGSLRVEEKRDAENWRNEG